MLICEGRSALPKSASAFSGGEGASAHGFDRAHRHLIDAIRQRDTDALIDAIENGTVDPNFTDDVGQTLLNWCSAFGTSDMVIYLCDKGADVNKGLRYDLKLMDLILSQIEFPSLCSLFWKIGYCQDPAPLWRKPRSAGRRRQDGVG